MIEHLAIGRESEFIVYTLILLFVGLISHFESDRLNLFLRSFTNTNLIDQQLRQERAFSRLALLAFVIVILVISTFVVNALQYHGFFLDFSFLGLFMSVLLVLILLTTARVALYAFLAWLFDLEGLQEHHTFHWLLTNLITCSLLLPVSVVYSFGPELLRPTSISFGMIVLAVFYTIRVLRLSHISNKLFRVPLHYNFLYICALEIMPLTLVSAALLR
jgi:hypothetical protein